MKLGRSFLVGLVLLTAVCAGAAPKPNLIVIMADDMGYADVGFNGCKDIPTPNIDRIAKNGVQFTSGYVAYSVCGPSRAAFMTGRYGQRFGFERNPQYPPGDPNMGLPLEERTFAEVLKPVGYVSGIIGKWHLGAHPTRHPLNRGFDFFYGHLGGGHQYLPKALDLKDSYTAKGEMESYRTWILRNHEAVPPTKYLTDEFSDEAVGFVERNQKNPFFLFLSYNAPHGPLQATDEYLARFPNIQDENRRTYAAMVSAVDDGVGRVLDTLEQLKLDDDTLVFFLSDNGGPEKKNSSDNGVLRGGKSDVWEGGFRVPFAAQWKGNLPAGIKYDNPVSSLDIMATIAELSNAPTDPKRPLDGVNLIPYVTGANKGIPHDTIYLRKFDQQRYAVRRDDYKLVLLGAGKKPMLFNLAKDIGEEQDIAGLHPEKLSELEQVRVKWDSELIEPRFLGLTQSAEWKAKAARAQKKKQAAKKKEWDWFVALDKNRDGSVTEAEWVAWGTKEKKKKGTPASEEKLKQNFAARDTNGDGSVSREELQAGKK